MSPDPALAHHRERVDFDGEIPAVEDSVYGVATASETVSGHVAAAPDSGAEPTPDQARWAGGMDRAALVHGPFQRLGSNGPGWSMGHSLRSIGVRCDKPSLTALVDVGETSIPQCWWRSLAADRMCHADLRRFTWLDLGTESLTVKGRECDHEWR